MDYSITFVINLRTVLQQYDNVIQDQLKKGMIQPVQDLEDTQEEKVHYLPHHAVIRQDRETTKLRVVYDSSAKCQGVPSLNNCLYSGTNFEQHILDILQRFRTYRIAFTADVEKAFLMIFVSEKDRDALRFLWVDDIKEDTPEVSCKFRFTCVVFGVTSSPFLLNATIQYHLKKYEASYKDLVDNLLKSICVDDIVSGAQDDKEALLMYKQSKSLFKAGGFNLQKFVTNDKHIQEIFDREEGVTKPTHNIINLDETYSDTWNNTDITCR